MVEKIQTINKLKEFKNQILEKKVKHANQISANQIVGKDNDKNCLYQSHQQPYQIATQNRNTQSQVIAQKQYYDSHFSLQTTQLNNELSHVIQVGFSNLLSFDLQKK